MAKDYKKYTIKKGDCLSLLAEKFNTTVEELQTLNSEQIKDIDLIYAGNEIDTPIKSDIKIDLTKSPEKNASNNDLCSGGEYVDILYVPADPTNGEKRYYAITEEAQKAIKKEQEILSGALDVNDKEKTIKNLNDLGVFSSFYTSPHGMFLDQKDRERYDFLVITLKTLQTGAYKGKDGFLKNLAEQELSNDQYEYLYDKKLKNYEIQIEMTKPKYWSVGGDKRAIDYIEKIAINEENEKKAIKKIKLDIEKDLEKKINSLEKKAKSKATITKSDDGSSYVYDEVRKYYTSKTEKELEENISFVQKKLNIYNDSILALNSHETADTYIREFHDVLEVNYPPDWRRRKYIKALKSINRYGYVIKEQCLSYSELEGDNEDERGPKQFKKNFSDWREHASSGKGLPIEIDKAEDLIDKLYKDINLDFSSIGKRDINGKINITDEKAIKKMLKETGAENWAYFPCLALISIIDATLIKWNSDINKLLGVNSNFSDSSKSNYEGKKYSYKAFPLPKIFSGILWIKKLAKARIDSIKKIAESRANLSQNLSYIDEDTVKFVKSFKVIWEDEKYNAKKKQKKVIRTDDDCIRVIECVLISEGNLGWVRGPAWYLPKEKCERLDAKGHLLDITKKVAMVSAQKVGTAITGKQTCKSLEEAMTAISGGFKKSTIDGIKSKILGGKLLLDLTSISKKADLEDATFWSDSYHWEDGLGPNNTQPQYVVDAAVQLVRFTASAQANINAPLSEYSGLKANTDAKFTGQYNMSFELFKGQLRYEAWYPLSENSDNKVKKTGQQVYFYYDNNTEKLQDYLLGGFFFHLTATVYASAAASICVSSNVQFGLSTQEDGKIGVRGSEYSLVEDYDKTYLPANSDSDSDNVSEENSNSTYRRETYSTSEATNRALARTSKYAADANVKMDMFAGVEAGGIIDGEIYWLPPKEKHDGYEFQDDIMRLGKLSLQASVSYGVGLAGEFRITIHNGAIYWIVAARLVTGPGASGKVAIEVDYLNIDKLFKHILNIYYQNGFDHIVGVGGDNDDYQKIYDENNLPADYKVMNYIITWGLFLGLNVGEVLLLPAKMWESYSYKNLKDDYGHILAKNIIAKENQKSTQEWVSQLPPEVLAKLLGCLSDIDDLSSLTVDNAKILVEKLDALVKVFGWIKEKSGSNVENTYNQYEITMSLIGGEGKLSNVTYIRWFNIYKGWVIISKLILLIRYQRELIDNILKNNKSISDDTYDNLIKIRSIIGSITIIEQMKSLNDTFELLSKNIKLFINSDDKSFISFFIKEYNIDYLINYNGVIVIKENVSGNKEYTETKKTLYSKVNKSDWVNKRWVIK
ncbi:LysM peptidoglycan-binding domain-containing protein [Vibrio nitrifigilis]|uniref:LysM peptidoglycan-binding domain-containing protein n=1 Tax=Vibrio nitrifigilis TaxID=2789781 RepID=A0ABS0GLV5_9VIBR|nr:LysM domain-containing protein [Vibrio nitrifigilis]MBF9003444.1 LysM peptidoglycan-binding domain-containing protein [Vibrio nitrifigilis]